MTPAIPLTRDLVLIGGGHAHALVLRRWGMDPLPGARLTLVDPNPAAPYTGMLPGHVAGHYPRAALEIDLVRLARFAGARLVRARAAGLDRAARHVIVEGRPPLPYDVVSIDVGITSAMPGLPGFAAHAVAAKPLGAFADRWAAFLAGPAGDACVIGGGIAGVELALAMNHALRGRGRVTVIEAGRALAGISAAAAGVLRARLEAAGIALIEGAAVAEVTPAGPRLADGRSVPAALTVGAAGARPWPWIAALGLPHTDGYLDVGAALSSPEDARVFGAGDCVNLLHAPRDKAGVYAVRAAPVLHDNLRAALSGSGARRRFDPQRHYLKLISLGGREALADRSGHALTAAPALIWRWKDRIDRRFMARVGDLPAMPAPEVPRRAAEGVAGEMTGAPVPCGGCGAKVGPDALAGALAALPRSPRADVEAAPGDDAAILRIGGARQVLTTDHLRAFTEDHWLLARVAALHALGDIWAMGAAPQAALAQIVLPRMSDRLQRETLREVMAAAAEVFAAEGAGIVGGHTTMGAEANVGFTVTGLAEAPITLRGAREGDALVLTRAIGSGTILAAEMAGAAGGATVAAALDLMAAPQGEIARALAPHARAMTDVTGFGLAGHLAGLCAASGVAARVDLSAVPLMAGAEALAAAGVRSSLHEANRAALEGRAVLPEGPRAALMADPQTAGGLLAAVPEAAVPALERMGAVRIGTVAAPGAGPAVRFD